MLTLRILLVSDIVTRIVAVKDELFLSPSRKSMPELIPSSSVADLKCQDEPAESEVTTGRGRSFGTLLHRVAPKDDVFALEYMTVLASLDEPGKVVDTTTFLSTGNAEHMGTVTTDQVIIETSETLKQKEISSITFEPNISVDAITVVKTAEGTPFASGMSIEDDSVSSITTATLLARPFVQFETIEESTGQYII